MIETLRQPTCQVVEDALVSRGQVAGQLLALQVVVAALKAPAPQVEQ